MTSSTRTFSMTAAALAGAVCFGVLTLAQGQRGKSLPNPDSSNFRDLRQITKENVHQLEVAWFYPYGADRFSPVFAHGVLYGLGRNGSSIVALDAATG